MSIADRAILRQHKNGYSSICPRRYSPNWWNSKLRINAYKHKPHLCVIHSNEESMQFLAFGGFEVATETLVENLGDFIVN